MDNQKIKILVVDDQPSNLRFLSNVLTEQGYQVQRAISGQLALNAALSSPPDLILLDIMMPDMDGYEVCKQLKSIEQTRAIPVIFLSILDEVYDKIKAFRVGGVDYIMKPFQVEEVLARIDKQIAIQRLQQQLKERNEKLQESQSLLAGILNSSLDGVAAFSALRNEQKKIVDFKLILLNPTAEKMLNRRLDELVGKQLLVEMPEHLTNGLFDAYVSVVETSQPLELEFFYHKGPVNGCWLQIAAVKLNDGFAITFRNITERKQAETALRESEERFRAIFEQAAVGIAHISLSGQFLRVNPGFCEILGYQESELLCRTWQEITHPDDLGTESEYIQEMWVGSVPTASMEKRYIRKDGQVRWVNVTISTMRIAEKIQYFIGVIQDVSERKQAEIALRESEERFRAIFEQAAVGISQTTLSGQFLRVNPGFCEIMGYTEAELLEMAWQEITHPDDVEPNLDYVSQLLAGHIQTYSLEKRYIRKDGGVQWVNSTTSAMRNATGTPQFLIGAIEDISERKQAQEQLQTSLEVQTRYAQELARSNAELEQFAYVASHDLQAPLSTIASYAQLLETRYQDQLEANAKKFINKIVKGAMRMQVLIDDLLEYSRVGRKNKPFAATDCNRVFEEACANLHLALRKNQAVVTRSNLPLVTADSSQLVQLFQNLISNAIKYRRDEPPVIRVTFENQEDCWLFAVQDNGIGIESKYSERIFQIFQRLHTQEEYSGTGIGLAICQKIVERHGGRIWVESQPGTGSTFYFTIPHKIWNSEREGESF